MPIITCNLMGGLGNQLFEIFTTISYAIEYGQQFRFANIETIGFGNMTIRKTFWNSFLSRLKPFTMAEFPQMMLLKEKSFEYNKLPVNDFLHQNIIIYGYFQSYKYFEKYYRQICRIIDLEMMQINLLQKLDISNTLDNTVSMHFRIGDYKLHPTIYPILNKAYYNLSLKLITEKHFIKTVMYFCEEEDAIEVFKTIQYLSKQFKEIEFVRGNNTLEDWEQMLLMSCCHHNIIANSTFSWWGAYFNNWEDKMVCYPAKWFGPDLPHNTKDLFPENWHKIEC